MRRLRPGARAQVCAVLTIACLLLLPVGCKRTRKRAPLEPITQGSYLASMIEVADPRTKVQLTRGFYDVEGNAWRWTARSFSATLRPPKEAGQKGARLVLRFALPDAVIGQLKNIRLSATVNGLSLPPEDFNKSGEYTYSRDVPATALTSEAVSVDFTLDKAMPPSASDKRELGVIVSALGFEAR